MSTRLPLERVVLDSTVVLGANRSYFVAAAELGYYTGYWSSWIVAEFARVRTEWIAERAVRDQCDLAELRRRLRASRARVNALLHDLSRVLQSVDYTTAPTADLSWLADADDWPVIQTALAAQADTLVTDNSGDFPVGEERNGILLVGSSAFLAALYDRFPDAEAAIETYLGRGVP